MQPRPHEDASDSEDDPDYVPHENERASSGDEEERDAKRQRTSSPQATEEELEEKKRVRETLWEQFKESASAPGSASTAAAPRLVKIEKRYRFAGEEVREVKEVPEDSDEAKKWPRWQESAVSTGSSSKAGPSTPSRAVQASGAVAEGSSLASTPAAEPTLRSAKPTKRPGPRKSKIALAPLEKKAKKLTTLDKSAIDWRSHVETSTENVKDELETNRRGGGYLEKVDFLQRVADRKEDALEASKSAKRRR